MKSIKKIWNDTKTCIVNTWKPDDLDKLSDALLELSEKGVVKVLQDEEYPHSIEVYDTLVKEYDLYLKEDGSTDMSYRYEIANGTPKMVNAIKAGIEFDVNQVAIQRTLVQNTFDRNNNIYNPKNIITLQSIIDKCNTKMTKMWRDESELDIKLKYHTLMLELEQEDIQGERQNVRIEDPFTRNEIELSKVCLVYDRDLGKIIKIESTKEMKH